MKDVVTSVCLNLFYRHALLRVELFILSVCVGVIHIFLFMYAVKSVFCTVGGLINFVESILTWIFHRTLNGHNTLLEDVKIFWFDLVVDINFLQLVLHINHKNNCLNSDYEINVLDSLLMFVVNFLYLCHCVRLKRTSRTESNINGSLLS